MLLRIGAPFVVVVAAAGCAGTVSTASEDAEPTATTNALLVVERVTDPAEGTRAEASARFVRAASPSSPEEALQSVGAALNLPARGACASIASLSGAFAPTEPAPAVELVDVGTVSIETGSVQTALNARRLPDVTDVVSGIIYARAADPTLFPADTRYIIHVDGRGAVAGFDVLVSAPSDPSDVHFDGSEVQGPVGIDKSTVDLSWSPSGAPDIVYVDVLPGSTRCVLAGEVSSLDSLVHASLSASLLADSGTVVVHRLRTEPLRAPGLGSGEVRFDFARSVAYVHR
jgi:hypothetical protein